MANRTRRDPAAKPAPNYIDIWAATFEPVKGPLLLKIAAMSDDDALELLATLRRKERAK